MKSFLLSGWQDSNLRPPRPKRGAITGLRYTPRWLSLIDYYHFQYLKTTKISSPVPGGVPACRQAGISSEVERLPPKNECKYMAFFYKQSIFFVISTQIILL